MRRTNPGAAAQPLIYAVALLVAGLGYRATFISQGFAATDEGWLQSLGYRIVHGQLPYRDFDYALPPLSIYKEAAFIKVFGDAYGILASRWAFAVLATGGSILTFVILRRYVSDHLAFWTALPTVFFSVILYYFSNYNYDAIVLLLAAIALLLYGEPDRPILAVLAGVAVGLAVLAKFTYGGFLPLLVVGALVLPRLTPDRTSTQRALDRWPLVLVGAAIPLLVVALAFIVAGAGGQFFFQSFLLYRAAHPGSTLSLIVQGIPSYVGRPAGLIGAIIAIALAVSPRRAGLNLVRTAVAVIGFAVVLFLTVRFTDRAQPAFLVAAFVCMWIVSAVALVAGLRGGFPSPELPLLAMGLQYMAQITYNGAVLYYLGAYLTLPLVLLFVWKATPHPDPPKLLVVASASVWLALGSVLVTRMTVYQDAPRDQLTAEFRSPKLRGIWSLPQTTWRIDAAVRAVDGLSRPDQPVLAFPDLAAMYFLADRMNATRVDWYNSGSITPEEVSQALEDLRRNPPAVVLLQNYRESDFARSALIDYPGDPKWDPIYEYLRAHYHEAEMAGGIAVLVPAS